MDLMTLALVALATARITRFVTSDRIFDKPRQYLASKLPEDGELVYLLHCPWCVSIYAGAGVAVYGWLLAGSAWFVVPAAALAASYITGFLADRTDD
jgi:hypothetical protein